MEKRGKRMVNNFDVNKQYQGLLIKDLKNQIARLINFKLGSKLIKYYQEYLDSPALNNKAIEMKDEDIEELAELIAKPIVVGLEKMQEEYNLVKKLDRELE